MSLALQVQAMKANRVLLTIDPSEVSSVRVNSFVVSADKSVHVKILQISKLRALGQVIKGTASVNMQFQPLAVRNNKTKDTYYGFLGGLSINSMNITVNSTTTVNLAGTGFNLLGFADYALLDKVTLRGVAGYESFNASAASTTCPSGTCSVKLNYLTAQAFAQYDLINFAESSRYWVALGFGGLMAASASSEIINTDTMKTNQIFILATGLDYKISDNTYIPVQVDYFLYPSGDIKTQQINIRLGYKF